MFIPDSYKLYPNHIGGRQSWDNAIVPFTLCASPCSHNLPSISNTKTFLRVQLNEFGPVWPKEIVFQGRIQKFCVGDSFCMEEVHLNREVGLLHWFQVQPKINDNPTKKSIFWIVKGGFLNPLPRHISMTMIRMLQLWFLKNTGHFCLFGC